MLFGTARTTTGTTITTTAALNDNPAEEGSAAAAAPVPRLPPSLDRSKPCSFIAKNNVNLDGDFISCKEGEPRAEELTNENLIKVLAQKGSDEEVNWILWKCLGEPRPFNFFLEWGGGGMAGMVGEMLTVRAKGNVWPCVETSEVRYVAVGRSGGVGSLACCFAVLLVPHACTNEALHSDKKETFSALALAKSSRRPRKIKIYVLVSPKALESPQGQQGRDVACVCVCLSSSHRFWTPVNTNRYIPIVI